MICSYEMSFYGKLFPPSITITLGWRNNCSILNTQGWLYNGSIQYRIVLWIYIMGIWHAIHNLQFHWSMFRWMRLSDVQSRYNGGYINILADDSCQLQVFIDYDLVVMVFIRSKPFTIETIFEIFGKVELPFFLRSWMNFHCADNLFLWGSHSMFPTVSGWLFQV